MFSGTKKAPLTFGAVFGANFYESEVIITDESKRVKFE